MELAAKEKIFLQENNVIVTHTRFTSGDKTFVMRNISSVTNHKIEKSRKWQKILIVSGSIAVLLDDTRILGLFLIVLGVVWLFFIKDEFSVRIRSNSGETDGLISKDEEYIERIVYAVDDALIFRA